MMSLAKAVLLGAATIAAGFGLSVWRFSGTITQVGNSLKEKAQDLERTADRRLSGLTGTITQVGNSLKEKAQDLERTADRRLSGLTRVMARLQTVLYVVVLLHALVQYIFSRNTGMQGGMLSLAQTAVVHSPFTDTSSDRRSRRRYRRDLANNLTQFSMTVMLCQQHDDHAADIERPALQ